MNLTDELQKLAELRRNGHLSEEEFADAKRRLIAGGQGGGLPTTPAIDDVPPDFQPRKYKSSRWSRGNLFFPDSLTLARDGMLFRKGALIGSNEEHINYRAVASCKVQNGLFLADVTIETSGGSQPIHINGLWKRDAREVQELIRAIQGARA